MAGTRGGTALRMTSNRPCSAGRATGSRSSWASCARSRRPSRKIWTSILVVVDNYCTHKHAKVRSWLAQRPRFHVHYTPI